MMQGSRAAVATACALRIIEVLGLAGALSGSSGAWGTSPA
jgi:hypothetical protein